MEAFSPPIITDSYAVFMLQMATRLICRRASVITANLRLAAGARHFSSYDEPQPANEDLFVRILSRSDTSFQWPDTRLGPLEPKDHRFPLPGLVGSVSARSQRQGGDPNFTQQKPAYDADVLTAELPHERQSSTYEQFMTVNKETLLETDGRKSKEVKSTSFDMLECTAHECPFLLRKDFFELFPNCHIHPLDNLTVLTFCQKPIAVEKPEAKLIADTHAEFLSLATGVCEELHDCGFWADFIDPASGRLHLGNNTHAASYEVEERYRNFGFEIEGSAGRCLVLRHHALGTRPFVGCVFTSAPVTHPLVVKIARRRSSPD